MSESVQLDQLLDEKSSVKDEGRRLDEEQRQLKLRAKELTEKIIQELKKKNDAKQKKLNNLRCDVNDLESQLKALTDSTVLGDTSEKVLSYEETVKTPFSEEPQETAEATLAFPEEPQETVEETLTLPETPHETIEETVTPPRELDIVSVTEVFEEKETDPKPKKKRKFL